MSESPSVRCLLCEARLHFKDGNQVKFEKHMKNNHEMNTNQINFILSIHFLTATEKDKLEGDMKIRVEIAMRKSTYQENESISERKMSDDIQTEMTMDLPLVKVVAKSIIVENEIEMIEDTNNSHVEEEDINCSYDGVKAAKEHAISTFKDVFFNDAPIPKRSLQNMFKTLKPPGPSGPPTINSVAKAFKKENKGLEIRKIARKKLLSCEFCDAKFSWRKDYKIHVEKNHDSPVKSTLQKNSKFQNSTKNTVEMKEEIYNDNQGENENSSFGSNGFGSNVNGRNCSVLIH